MRGLHISKKGLVSAVERWKKHPKLLVFQRNHLNIRMPVCSKITYFPFAKGNH